MVAVGSTGSIAVSDSNPDVVWLGTGSPDPRGNISNGDGVYKSTDAGKTWTHMGLEKAGLIGRVRIHPTNPDIVFVAVIGNISGPNKERGVYRTKDGGKTWEQVLSASDKTGAVDLSMDPKNPNVIFASMWAVKRESWSITSGSMDGGDGDSKTEVAKVVARKNSAVQRCYEQALRDNPDEAGKVKVTFTVGTAGTVTDVSVSGASGSFSECIKAKFSSIRGFPTLPSPQTFSQSYVFSKGG